MTLTTNSSPTNASEYPHAVPVGAFRTFVLNNGMYYLPDPAQGVIWRFDPAGNRASIYATGLSGITAVASDGTSTSSGTNLFAVDGSQVWQMSLPSPEPAKPAPVPVAQNQTSIASLTNARGISVMARSDGTKALLISTNTSVRICTIGACSTPTLQTVANAGFTYVYAAAGRDYGANRQIVIADKTGNRVFTVTETGTNGSYAYSAINTALGDGSVVAATQCTTTVVQPQGLTFDPSGNLWLSSDNCLRRYAMSTSGLGSLTATVGVASAGWSTVAGGAASSARFNDVESMAFDSSGNLTIADVGNGRLRTMSFFQGTVSQTGGSASSLQLRYTSPAGLGTITNYQYSVDGGTSYCAFSPVQKTATITITKNCTGSTLTGNTSYTVQVKAVTAAGVQTPTSPIIAKTTSTSSEWATQESSFTPLTLSMVARFAFPDASQSVSQVSLPNVGAARLYNGSIYVLDTTLRTILRITGSTTTTVVAALTTVAGSTTTLTGTNASVKLFTPTSFTIAPSPSGATIYLVDDAGGIGSGSDRLYRVTYSEGSSTDSNPPTLSVLATLGGYITSGPVEVSADKVFVRAAETVYGFQRFSSGGSEMTNYTTADASWTASIAGVSSLALSSDQKTLYAAASGSGPIYRVETDKGTVAASSISYAGGSIAAGPDGQLYSVDASGFLNVYDTSGSSPAWVALGGGQTFGSISYPNPTDPAQIANKSSTLLNIFGGVTRVPIPQADLAVTAVTIGNDFYPGNNEWGTSGGNGLPNGASDAVPSSISSYVTSCNAYNSLFSGALNCSAPTGYTFGRTGRIDVTAIASNAVPVGPVTLSLKLNSTTPVLFSWSGAIYGGPTCTSSLGTGLDAGTQTWQCPITLWNGLPVTTSLYFQYPSESRTSITATATVSGGVTANFGGVDPTTADNTLPTGSVTMARYWDLRGEVKQWRNGVLGAPLDGQGPGRTGRYAIQFSNRGPASMPGGFTATLPVPSGASIANITATPGLSCSASSGPLTCTGPALSVHNSGWLSDDPQVDFDLTWPPSGTVGANQSLVVTAQANDTSATENYTSAPVGGQPLAGDRKRWTQDGALNGGVKTTTINLDAPRAFVTRQSNVAATVKIAGAAPGVSAVSAQLRLTNTGVSPSATPVSVQATFPTGTTFGAVGGNGYTCTTSANVVTCTSPDAIAAGTIDPIVVPINIARPTPVAASGVGVAAAGVNTVSAQFLSGNEYGEGTSTSQSIYDMTVTSVQSESTLSAANPGRLAIVLANQGISSASAPAVTVALPTGITYNAAGTVGPSGWTCDGTNPAAPVCSAASGALAAGDTVTVYVPISVSGSLGGSYNVTATASAATSASAADADATNDARTLAVVIKRSAVSSSVDVNGANQGATSQTINVMLTNPSSLGATSESAGPVTVRVTLPSGSVFGSGGGAGGFTCAVPGGQPTNVVDCTSASALALNGSVTVPITANLGNSSVVAATYTAGAQWGAGTNTPGAIGVQADIAVTDASPGSALIAATTNTLTASITNNGPSTATNVQLAWDLSTSGMTYRSAGNVVPAGWSCSGTDGGTSVSCTAASLASGSSYRADLTLGVAVSATGAGTKHVVVNGSATESDAVPVNNTSDATVTVAPSADLQVAGFTATADAGRTGSFTVVATNAGAYTATNAVVTVALPTGVSFLSGSGGGFTCSVPDALAPQTVTCTKASFGVTTASITFSVQLDAALSGAKTVGLSIASDVADPIAGNNAATGTLTVNAATNVSVSLTGPASVTRGSTANLTLQANNLSGVTAANTTMVVTIGSGLTVTSAPGCTQSGVTLTCALGAFAGNSNTTVLIDVSVAATGTVAPSSAAIVTDTFDTGTSNDTATYAPSTMSVTDLAVSASNASLAAGTNATYTVTVANAGPSSAAAPVVTVVLPSDVAYAGGLSGTYTCTSGCSSSQTVTFTGSGPLASGANVAFTFTASVATSATGSLDTAISVAKDANESNAVTADNAVTVTGTVAVAADLQAALSGAALTQTQSATYTATITNAGPADAQSVSVAVTPTTGLSIDAGASGGSGFTCIADGGGATCTRTVMTATGGGATVVSFPIAVVVAADAPTTGSVSIAVTSATTDPDTSNNVATDASRSIARAADLSVALSGISTVTRGASETITATITNAGPSTATDAQLTVTLGSGFSVTSAPNCSVAGSVVTCELGSVAVGSTTRTVSMMVAATGAIGSVDAAIAPKVPAAPQFVDLVTANNTDSVTPTVQSITDLGVAVVARGVAAGYNTVVALTVTNAGPSNSGGITAHVPLPDGVSYLGSSSTDGLTCDVAAGPPAEVTCTRSAALVAGGQATVELSLAVASSVTDDVTFSATVNHDAHETNFDNNAASQLVTPGRAADLAVTQVALVGSVLYPGQNADYTVTIANTGPADADQVDINLLFPTGMTYTGVSSADSSIACAGGGAAIACVRSALANGATVTFTVHTALVGTATGTQSVTATIAPSTTEVVDGNATNDTLASTPVTVTPVADRAIALSGPTTVTRGATATFTATVSNAGPSAATNTSIAFTLGSGFSVTSAPGCSVAVAAVQCDVGNVAAGGTADASVTVAVAATGSIGSLNVALAAPDGLEDRNATNDAQVLTPAVQSVSDLAIGLATGTVGAGTDTTLTLTATNHGPSNQSGATVRFTVPDGWSYTAAESADGFTCSVVSAVVSCSTDHLLVPDASVSVTLTVQLGATVQGATSLVAAVDAGTGEAAGTLTDNTTTVSVTPARVFDLGIGIALVTDALRQGQPATYTLTLANAGPADPGAITATLTLPDGLTYRELGDPANGVTCSASGATLTCHRSSLSSGASVDVPVVLDVGSHASGAKHIAAVIAADDNTLTDIDNTNNSAASSDLTITPIADLAVGYTAPDQVFQATTALYTAAVANLGPSAAEGPITLTVTLPAKMTFHDDGSGGDGWSCTADVATPTGQTVTCTHADPLPVSNSTTSDVALWVDVAADAQETLVPTMSVSGATEDLHPANNTATIAGVSPLTSADLGITIDRVGTPTVGGSVTYTATVTNESPMPSDEVVVSMAAGVGLEVSNLATVQSSSFVCSGTQLVVCRRAQLDAHTTVTVSVTFDVGQNADAQAEILGAVAASTYDPNPMNDADINEAPVARTANLGVALAVGTVARNASTTITATVSNAGPSNAVAPSVEVVLPNGMTYHSASGATCAATGQTVRCTWSQDLPANSTASVTIIAIGGPSLSGSVTFTATASATTDDPVFSNNAASVARETALPPALSVSAQPVGELVMGDTGTIRITVTNVGSGAAQDVTVQVTLPDGLSLDSRSKARVATPTTLSLGTIAAGATVQRDLAVQVADNLPANITIGIAANSPSLSSGAITSSLATPVVRISDLSLGTAAGTPVLSQPLPLTFSVSNAGPSTAPGPIVVRVTLSGDLQSPVGAGAGWSCTFAAPTMTCTHADALGPNTTATFTITGVLTSLEHLSSLATATIEANGTTDRTPGDQQATITFSPAVIQAAAIGVSSAAGANLPVAGQPNAGTTGNAKAGAPNAARPSTARPTHRSRGLDYWMIAMFAMLILGGLGAYIWRRRIA